MTLLSRKLDRARPAMKAERIEEPSPVAVDPGLAAALLVASWLWSVGGGLDVRGWR